MPPPGHESMLSAVLRQPADDLVRLAYADWLEENGDADRAAFIRVQCRLAQLGVGPMSPHVQSNLDIGRLGRGMGEEARRLFRQQTALWGLHHEEWLAELPPLTGCTVLFHRGFASEVRVPADPVGFLEDGERLLAVAPVNGVTLVGCGPREVSQCLRRPWFEAFRRLTVRPTNDENYGDRIAPYLADAKHLGGLRDLVLSDTGMPDAGAVVLASAPLVGRLARLDLARNEIRAAGADAIVNAVDPERLRVLELTGNPIPDRVKPALYHRLGERLSL